MSAVVGYKKSPASQRVRIRWADWKVGDARLLYQRSPFFVPL